MNSPCWLEIDANWMPGRAARRATRPARAQTNSRASCPGSSLSSSGAERRSAVVVHELADGHACACCCRSASAWKKVRQATNHVFDVAVHHGGEIVPGEADAVIGETILGKL